jgi:hypothetical protein
MKKTAAIILNHNLPKHTDKLYESLKPYEREDYDLFIFDNGSRPEGVAKNTTHNLDRNVYMGGGFFCGLKFTLENDKYDSLLFLNNDIVVYPYNYVKNLRKEMFWIDGSVAFDIVSPCIHNVEEDMFWKTMHNWGKPFIRDVPFIDFQTPLISRRILEMATRIDDNLLYGWGIDWYFAILAHRNNFKIGVIDRISTMHHNRLTIKSGACQELTLESYKNLAFKGQIQFLLEHGLMKDYEKLRFMAENYSC